MADNSVSNCITVRIPRPGSHKDKHYNPFHVTKSDKAILLPSNHLSDFVSRGLVEPGAHQQQIMLLAAADYYKTKITSLQLELKSCDSQIKVKASELDTLKSNRNGPEPQIVHLEKEISSCLKGLSRLIETEQSVSRTAKELVVKLYIVEESLLNSMSTFQYLQIKVGEFLHYLSPHDSCGALADWARSQQFGLADFISRMQDAGVDVSSFADDVYCFNGSGPRLLIPPIDPKTWSDAASKVLASHPEQLAVIDDCVSCFENDLNQAKPTKSNFSSVYSRRFHRKLIDACSQKDFFMPYAENRLEFACNLRTISSSVPQFDTQMRNLLDLNASLKALRSIPKNPNTELPSKEAELALLQKKRIELKHSISSLQSEVLEIKSASELMGDVFKQKQEHAVRRSQRALRCAAEFEQMKTKTEAERVARLASEQARLSAIIERTKPKLVQALWRKDRFKFCKVENEHIVFDEFKSKVMALASIYVENDGKLTASALVKAFEASNPIHWETNFISGRVLARIALTADKNYRILLYIADVGDPIVLYVGAHSGSDKFLDERLSGKPKADWVPEWHNGLFRSVLQDALNAKKELDDLEKEALA